METAAVILFALPPYEALADALASVAHVVRGHSVVARFANGELHATVDSPVTERDCVLLAGTAPPSDRLLATSLLGDTLRRMGARRITALLPYLGYARQDRVEAGKSLGVAWSGRLLEAVGIGEAVTVDVHSRRGAELFPIPVRSLSPAPLFAAELRILALSDPTIVAPDEGARERCEAVRMAGGVERPVAYLVKKRTAAGVIHSARQGDVGREAVIVDDILDTGGTLVSACETLRGAGVDQIIVMVTHALFTGRQWERLWSLNVAQVYCTDTAGPADALSRSGVVVLSIAPLLHDWLRSRAATFAEPTGTEAGR